MLLKPDEKFILPDDDGNLILITEIEFDYSVLQNRVIPILEYEMQIEELLDNALDNLNSKEFEKLLERVKEAIENFD